MKGSVAHFRSDFSRGSERFVTAPIMHLRSWRPVMIGWRVPSVGGAGPAMGRIAYEELDPRGPLSRARWRWGYHPPAALALARREGIRVFHAHFGEDGALALPLARKLGVPLVVSFYGHDVTRLPTWRTRRVAWLHYWLRFNALRARTAVALAYCRFLADRLVTLGWPETRVRVHYPGVVLPDVPRWRLESRLILSIGRLVEKKGFDTLIEAAAVMRGQGLEFQIVILGDGPLLDSLRALALRRGVADAVTFAGWVAEDGLPAWYARAALLVAASQRARDGDMEGMPTALVEAAAHGIPLVGTRHAGIPEVVRDGETGIVVPERDPAALAAGLRTMLENHDFRTRCAEQARRLVAAEFSLEGRVATLEAVYDDLAATPSAPAT